MMMSLDHAWALWLLALLPAAVVLALHAFRRQRAALTLLGDAVRLQALARIGWPARRWKAALFIAGLALLVAGSAGPRWGDDPDAELALAGRDIVVVVDQSRSMLAEQPSRQERARRALDDLADALQRSGGHRLALVIFAAQPKLLFPLTSDLDHFRAVVDKLDADNLPADMRPDADRGPTSGTRIGAALTLAVEAHDPRFAGAQDILLLSDGDDPGDDGEWARGLHAARRQKIPVHVVGLGDPDTSWPIPFRGGRLRHGDKVVTTRLHEKPLEEIASRTDGTYISARTQVLPLGRWFRDVIASRQGSPRHTDDATSLRLLRPRYGWFLAGALVLIAVSMLLPERKGARLVSLRWTKAATAALVLILVSAAKDDVDDLVRRAAAAYDGKDYDTAVALLTQAEEHTVDPGLIAFNKGAALFRLGRYREAELHFRRCLQDTEAPLPRLARAWYDLGNCLVKQAGVDDVKSLETALGCYRECDRTAGDDVNLRADARHNFEIARLLWLTARTKSQQKNERPEPHETTNDTPPPKKDKSTEKNGDDPGLSKEKNKLAALGKLSVLPDVDHLTPLSPQDTMSFLERTRARVLQERRDFRRQGAMPSDRVKDW
ncbi:MAG: VWA domain-containing protein [Planctomycetes bacterium]|nr:VWA domain-containing protein [Planctomycetota bacterium]